MNDAPQNSDQVRPSGEGLLVVDREFNVISFSDAAQRLFEVSVDEVVGRPVNELFGPEAVAFMSILGEAFETGREATGIEVEVTDRSGAKRRVSVGLSPLRDVHGGTAGIVLTCRDIREGRELSRQQAKQILEASIEKSKLEGILNSITDGVFTVDSKWRITSFNRAAEQITGYTKLEALGQNCAHLLEGSLCGDDCPMRHTIETGLPTYDAEVEITGKDGRRVPISVNTALLYDDDGEVVGAVETFRDLSKIQQLTEALEGRYRFDRMLGKSKSMQELYDLLQNVVESDATVLIQGESGTGKELVARTIHHNGARREKPFVAVNCAGLVESLLESELFGHEKGAFTGAIRSKPGRFELADGGTLFLDEVGDMPPALQAKLLRVLDEQTFERVGGTRPMQVDVRVIAATNKDLVQEVGEGRFREDLYYRLNVVPITLPPLRQRTEDIPLLIDHFIEHFNRKTGRRIRSISPEALDHLMSYRWPGNIRELENAIEQAFVRCRVDEIRVEHLPQTIRTKAESTELASVSEARRPLEEGERLALARVLEEAGGSRVKAARRLGISKATLWRKMKKHGMI